MGKLAYRVHYLNKYFGGRVDATDHSIDAYDKKGSHMVHLEKDGNGHWKDCSDEAGCEHRHSLEPLPKEARAWKLYSDGRIGKSEEWEERSKHAAELVEKHGHVPSQAELDKAKK